MKMKNFLKAIYHYFFKRPKFKNIWGGAFNGQDIRKKMFLELIGKLNIESIVETGTFRGNTTIYLYENSNARIYTVEGNVEYFRYNQIQFFGKKRIRLKFGDSRVFLEEFFKKHKGGNTFFYLDAHWDQDLPLGEELRIIFQNQIDAVVMIDDFQVPDDAGYTYDSYGKDKTLSLEYLNQHMPVGYHTFFPVSSQNETGAKRGCVVITASDEKASAIQTCQFLREYKAVVV